MEQVSDQFKERAEKITDMTTFMAKLINSLAAESCRISHNFVVKNDVLMNQMDQDGVSIHSANGETTH